MEFHNVDNFFLRKKYLGVQSSKMNKVDHFIIDYSAYEIHRKKWQLL